MDVDQWGCIRQVAFNIAGVGVPGDDIYNLLGSLTQRSIIWSLHSHVLGIIPLATERNGTNSGKFFETITNCLLYGIAINARGNTHGERSYVCGSGGRKTSIASPNDRLVGPNIRHAMQNVLYTLSRLVSTSKSRIFRQSYREIESAGTLIAKSVSRQ
jgi:hypothetical protein